MTISIDDPIVLLDDDGMSAIAMIAQARHTTIRRMLLSHPIARRVLRDEERSRAFRIFLRAYGSQQSTL